MKYASFNQSIDPLQQCLINRDGYFCSAHTQSNTITHTKHQMNPPHRGLTPAFSGAASGIGRMMRDLLRGLRCNALLGGDPSNSDTGVIASLARGCFTLILRLKRFDRTKEADDPLQLSVGAKRAEINAFHHCLAISANKLPGEPEHSMMEVCTA